MDGPFPGTLREPEAWQEWFPEAPGFCLGNTAGPPKCQWTCTVPAFRAGASSQFKSPRHGPIITSSCALRARRGQLCPCSRCGDGQVTGLWQAPNTQNSNKWGYGGWFRANAKPSILEVHPLETHHDKLSSKSAFTMSRVQKDDNSSVSINIRNNPKACKLYLPGVFSNRNAWCVQRPTRPALPDFALGVRTSPGSSGCTARALFSNRLVSFTGLPVFRSPAKSH